MKSVKITSEFITLGKFLKFANIIDSGAMAKEYLQNTIILVNGEEENRRGRKLYPGYEIRIANTTYIIGKE